MKPIPAIGKEVRVRGWNIPARSLGPAAHKVGYHAHDNLADWLTWLRHQSLTRK